MEKVTPIIESGAKGPCPTAIRENDPKEDTVRKVLAGGGTGLAVGVLCGAASPLAAVLRSAMIVGSRLAFSAANTAAGAAVGGVLGGVTGSVNGVGADSPLQAAEQTLCQVGRKGVTVVGVAAGFGVIGPPAAAAAGLSAPGVQGTSVAAALGYLAKKKLSGNIKSGEFK